VSETIRRICQYNFEGSITRDCALCGKVSQVSVLRDNLTNEILLVCNDCFCEEGFVLLKKGGVGKV